MDTNGNVKTMKKEFCLISAIAFSLAGCATSDLPELPSVIAQPQSVSQGELRELPRLPEARQPSVPSQVTELPQLPATPQVADLPPAPELPQPADIAETTQSTPATNSSTLTQLPQVEILTETTEQSEVIAEADETATELPQAPEVTQAPATAAPTPTQTTSDDTRIDIEFAYNEQKPPSSNSIPLELIADDLVSVLAYIPNIDPTRSSIRISTPGSEFDNLVKASMQRLGYSFNKGSSRDRRQHLTTTFSETRRDLQRSELTAIMAIDGTLIKRIYVMQNNTVTGATQYNIHGIDEQLVLPSDQIKVL
jgi:hypothetical protein